MNPDGIPNPSNDGAVFVAENWGETKEAKMEYNRGREYRDGGQVL